MPKENRKRGRRDEKKRKREAVTEEEHDTKRRRQSQELEAPPANYIGLGQHEGQEEPSLEGVSRPDELPYYGHLDEEEQEYFKRADQMLELNQFDTPEDKTLFLNNVYKEADGKELKLASSQSCSRLMEKLISLSNEAQLKMLFQKFNGQFLNMVQHRFASHCCEALFLKAAPFVTKELLEPPNTNTDPNEIYVSFENLFLYAINELEQHLGFLMTDKFASHTLRVLLFVLSGLPLSHTQTKSLIQSKRKENHNATTDITSDRERSVPDSFSQALGKLIQDTVAGLDTTYLRALSLHATGNPTLQLLIQLELSRFGKHRAKDETSVTHRLLPDNPIAEGTGSATFINGLVYDPIGSRLLETILEYAPGKMFKTLYREFFRERIGSLARNEIAGYVVAKILSRLSKDDLTDAIQAILPQIPGMVDRGRTTVIKTLVERCVARDVDTTPIAAQLASAYKTPTGSAFNLTKLLKLGEQEQPAVQPQQPQGEMPRVSQSDKRHGSLLAQALLNAPGRSSGMIFDAFVQLGSALSLEVARDPSASHALQAALKSPHASIIFRRKMIQQFYGHIGEMALDPSASHVIDAIWDGTQGLAFIRERIAEELAENEASLRESFVGRAVWKNWHMDLYRRRRADWVQQSRAAAGNDGFQPFPEDAPAPDKDKLDKRRRAKSALDLARERHAAKKKNVAAV